MHVDTGEFKALAADVAEIRREMGQFWFAMTSERVIAVVADAVVEREREQVREQNRKNRPRRANPAGLQVARGGDR